MCSQTACSLFFGYSVYIPIHNLRTFVVPTGVCKSTRAHLLPGQPSISKRPPPVVLGRVQFATSTPTISGDIYWALRPSSFSHDLSVMERRNTVRASKKASGTAKKLTDARHASIRGRPVPNRKTNTRSDGSWRRRAALTSPIPNSGASFHTQGLQSSDGSNDTSHQHESDQDNNEAFAKPTVRYPRGSQAAWENVLSAPTWHVESSSDGSEISVGPAEVVRVALCKVGNLTTFVHGERVPLAHSYCFDVEVLCPGDPQDAAPACELHQLRDRLPLRPLASNGHIDVIAKLREVVKEQAQRLADTAAKGAGSSAKNVPLDAIAVDRPYASPPISDQPLHDRVDDEEERFQRFLNRLQTDRDDISPQVSSASSASAVPSAKTSSTTNATTLKDPAIVAFEIRTGTRSQAYSEPSEQARAAANQYLAEQLNRMHSSSNSGSNDSGYASNDREGISGEQRPVGGGQDRRNTRLNPAAAEFKASSQTENDDTMPWLAPKRLMARQPLTNIFPDAMAAASFKQGGAPSVSNTTVHDRVPLPTVTTGSTSNTNVPYPLAQATRAAVAAAAQVSMTGTGAAACPVSSFGAVPGSNAASMYPVSALSGISPSASTASAAAALAGLQGGGLVFYPASTTTAPTAVMTTLGSTAVAASSGGAGASQLQGPALGAGGAPAYPLNVYNTLAPSARAPNVGGVPQAPVLQHAIPDISGNAMAQTTSTTTTNGHSAGLVVVPSAAVPAATPASLATSLATPVASGPVATTAASRPPRPYFPVTTKPRDHDPVKQQLYEAYLEWRKANEPGYHISCKMRQANRVLRQCQQQQLLQRMGQQQGQQERERVPGRNPNLNPVSSNITAATVDQGQRGARSNIPTQTIPAAHQQGTQQQSPPQHQTTTTPQPPTGQQPVLIQEHRSRYTPQPPQKQPCQQQQPGQHHRKQQQPMCMIPVPVPPHMQLSQLSQPLFSQAFQLGQPFPMHPLALASLSLTLQQCQQYQQPLQHASVAVLAGDKDLARWKMVAERAKAAVSAVAAAAREEKLRREHSVKEELRTKVLELSSCGEGVGPGHGTSVGVGATTVGGSDGRAEWGFEGGNGKVGKDGDAGLGRKPVGVRA
ncbi:hypothetical protein VTJ83DRAFT_7220 [Remersonia thermophila]|uniref:Uncharacterized protein n=1 Tax=Remersonia thermophila TaxID=72144 RepID=A0ABR4D2Z7_9PEZI